MLKILVTGAMGQLGRAIAACAVDHPFSFTFADVDDLDLTVPIEEMESYVDSVFGIRPSVKADRCLIINCAAYTQVDKAEEAEMQAQDINADVVAKLAKLVEIREYIGLIHLSTDYVFDGTAHRPYQEGDAPYPLSAYGRTKLQGERFLAGLMAQGRALVARTAWLYSPYGSNFVATMLRLAATKAQIRVVSDQIGTPTYAPHLAAILLRIAYHYSIEGSFRTPLLHITDEGAATWYDLAAYAIRQAGYTACKVLPIMTEDYPTPARRPAYGLLSKQRLATVYGIYPPHWTIGVESFLVDSGSERV